MGSENIINTKLNGMKKIMLEKKEKRQWHHSSFYLTPSDQEMIKFLTWHWGLNKSALIRRLLCEAYGIEQFKLSTRICV